MKTLLVCGGRDFFDRDLFQREMIAVSNQHGPFSRIISGGARGADTMAREIAKAWNKQFTEYPADWTRYGRRAGFLRNTQMLVEGKPDHVIAFPGGVGTAMMVRIAKEAGVPVTEVTVLEDMLS